MAVDLPPVTGGVGRLIDFIWDRVKDYLRQGGVGPDGVRTPALLGELTLHGVLIVPLRKAAPAVGSPFSLPVPAADAGTIDAIQAYCNTPPTDSPLRLQVTRNGVPITGAFAIAAGADSSQMLTGAAILNAEMRRGDIYRDNVLAIGAGARDVDVALYFTQHIHLPIWGPAGGS